MIRGTSHDQDARFKDKAQKMLLQSTWPDKYDTKISLQKVDFEALKLWLQKRTTELLGYEDDIVSGTVLRQLQQYLNKQEKPNAKKIHIAMSGFLSNHTLTLVSQLWDWLDEAQKSKSGISKRLLDEKKLEQNKKRQKMKQINQRRDKIKNYKFDVIKNHVGRQKQPDSQVKRQQRAQNQTDSRKKKKDRRSDSGERERDRKKYKRKYSHQIDEKQSNRKHKQESKRKSKKRRQRSYSRSSSSQNESDSRSRSRSRSRNKNKNSHNYQHNNTQNHSQSIQKKERKKKKHKKKGNRKASVSKSQSSEVVSSSNQS